MLDRKEALQLPSLAVDTNSSNGLEPLDEFAKI